MLVLNAPHPYTTRDVGIGRPVYTTVCPLSATERFPSPRHEHGTVCQLRWRHQIPCKPSKPNWNLIYSWRRFHSF